MNNPYRSALLGLALLAMLVAVVAYVSLGVQTSAPLQDQMLNARTIAVASAIGSFSLTVGVLVFIVWLVVSALTWRLNEATGAAAPKMKTALPKNQRMSAVDARLQSRNRPHPGE